MVIINFYIIGRSVNCSLFRTYAAVFHGVDTLSAESVDRHDADVGALL